MLTYNKTQSAWFFSKKDPRWELSNMAGGMPVYWPMERLLANRWNSSEQLYQACKYSTSVKCLPADNPDSDPCVRSRIRNNPTARGAKMTQKCAVKAGLVRPDWEAPDEIRVKAMVWVLELKLYWNPFSFRDILAGTGDQPIVEISKKDDFWGCMETPGGLLCGENQLGLALMQLRARISSVARGEFTHSEGYLLS